METIHNTSPIAVGPLVAHLWDRGKSGWALEIASGHVTRGFVVHSYEEYPSKIEAKKAAKAAGAKPWNY